MLEIQDLEKRYGSLGIIKRLNLAVGPGTILGITGANGIGKTTLLRLVAGLEVPDGGEIRFDGRCWSSTQQLLSPWERSIGTVFQGTNLWPHLTVREQVLMMLKSSKDWRSRDAKLQRGSEVLMRLTLQTIQNRLPSELSGGEQQRAALARALVRLPRLLLLDEPFSQMDSASKLMCWEVLQESVVAQNRAALVITHDSTGAPCKIAQLSSLMGIAS